MVEVMMKVMLLYETFRST